MPGLHFRLQVCSARCSWSSCGLDRGHVGLFGAAALAPVVPPLGGLLIASVLLKPPEISRARRWNFTFEMVEIANRMMNSASSSVIMSA